MRCFVLALLVGLFVGLAVKHHKPHYRFHYDPPDPWCVPDTVPSFQIIQRELNLELLWSWG